MSKVVSLNGSIPSRLGEPRDALVKSLEALVDKAKDGTLQSFVGTGFFADGQRLAVWHDTHENVHEMLGALVWLEKEYISRHT